MSLDRPDILADLDFEPEPAQCEALTGPAGQRCTAQATTYTKVHALGGCLAAGLTPDGGLVSLFCGRHAAERACKVGELVQASLGTKARLGQFLHCRTCARPITEIASIWEARPL
ncbi:hypothetical protein DS6A_88 [Mycobacterium phage DS6A]|uniref:Uncharacterized protein n=1 Tax=Mycobacterium phage DS6A TaxID=45764 RepID=G8I4J8_9CAUD|nr:hypothetical protein DS6A_88 [Mycobacterium phage DS6A]AER47642.1 hypothetical protein DS6A_88 [Mycobacterium phage DS6A]